MKHPKLEKMLNNLEDIHQFLRNSKELEYSPWTNEVHNTSGEVVIYSYDRYIHEPTRADLLQLLNEVIDTLEGASHETA